MVDRNSVKEKMAVLLKQPVSRLQDDTVLTGLVAESFALIEMVIFILVLKHSYNFSNFTTFC